MYCVSYGRKRDKRIVLSCNMISWEYVTLILTFYTHWISFHMFLFVSPLFSFFSYEYWGTKNEYRATNKPEIFGPVWENSVTINWNASARKRHHTHVWEKHKRFKEGYNEVKYDSKRGRPFTSKTEVIVKRVRQVVGGDCWLTVQVIAS